MIIQSQMYRMIKLLSKRATVAYKQYARSLLVCYPAEVPLFENAANSQREVRLWPSYTLRRCALPLHDIALNYPGLSFLLAMSLFYVYRLLSLGLFPSLNIT